MELCTLVNLIIVRSTGKENRHRLMALFTQGIMLIVKSKVKVLADMLMGPATLVNGMMASITDRAPTYKLM